jgi:hypothetical protein
MLVDELADDPIRFVLLSRGELALLELAAAMAVDAPLRRALERRIQRRLWAAWLCGGGVARGEPLL